MFDPDRRHLLAYLAAAAVLIVIAVRFIGHHGQAAAAGISMAAPAPTPLRGAGARPRPRTAPAIWVDVAGAVRRPGLYRLPAGSRVATALARAGGVRARAERTAVNLAAKLSDGQQIFVPVRAGSGGGSRAASAGGASGSPAGASASGGASAGAQAGAAGSVGSGSAPGIPGAKISLSNATQEQLETLDGIGPALAGRIIEYRQSHGGFHSIDELQEVSGIGEKRFKALRGSIEP
jgi:competence protein ComEA